jgi:hypothetical protein
VGENPRNVVEGKNPATWDKMAAGYESLSENCCVDVLEFCLAWTRVRTRNWVRTPWRFSTKMAEERFLQRLDGNLNGNF